MAKPILRFLLGILVALTLVGAQCSTTVKNDPEGGGTKKAKLGDTITLKGTDTELAVTVEDVTDPVQTADFDKPLSKNARYVGVEAASRTPGAGPTRTPPETVRP